MKELERHIETLLLSNDCVIVPDFGGFMAHHVDAHYDGKSNMFLPPMRTIGFNPQLKLNDSLLAQSYVEAFDISYPEAINRLEDEVAELRQRLENEGKIEFNNIGVLYLNEEGNYSFEPCESGILTPGLYGLGNFDMLPLQAMDNAANSTTDATSETSNAPTESFTVNSNSVFDVKDDDEDNKHAEFILIKKSWLRNLAAACIALVAFFAVSTPLKTPTLQVSKIDTGMLTRIMPKELVQVKNAKDLQLHKDANSTSKAETTEKSLETQKEQEEIKNATPYYSIVLASRITKRNAASYTESLQAKGYKDTKVVITPSNVKVVYGTYDTEEQARKALGKLRDQDIFSDSWITKVTE